MITEIPQAHETGLIPKHWKLISDDPETEIDETHFVYFRLFHPRNCSLIDGNTVLDRAETNQAFGSLGFARLVLDKQIQVRPEAVNGNQLLLPRTIVQGRNGLWHIGYLEYDFRLQLKPHFVSLAESFSSKEYLLVGDKRFDRNEKETFYL